MARCSRSNRRPTGRPSSITRSRTLAAASASSASTAARRRLRHGHQVSARRRAMCAACGIGACSGSVAVGGAIVQRTNLSCNGTSPRAAEAESQAQNAAIFDIINHFRRFSGTPITADQAAAAARGRTPAHDILAHPPDHATSRSAPASSCWRLIPVVGFLVNGTAFTTGEAEVEDAFDIVKHAADAGRCQPGLQGALGSMRMLHARLRRAAEPGPGPGLRRACHRASVNNARYDRNRRRRGRRSRSSSPLREPARRDRGADSRTLRRRPGNPRLHRRPTASATA